METELAGVPFSEATFLDLLERGYTTHMIRKLTGWTHQDCRRVYFKCRDMICEREGLVGRNGWHNWQRRQRTERPRGQAVHEEGTGSDAAQEK